MPKYLVPSTPDTLPLYIARRLDALGSFPNDEDLDEIRVLLYTYQEERVISDEELQEWKKSEEKILKTQNTYKKNTEPTKRTVDYSIPFKLLCILPVVFSIRVLRSMLATPLTLLDRWPIDLIVVFIHLYYFHGFELGLKQGTPNPVQPEVVENEDDDDEDDWEGPMTSTELQSRQKALVRAWETIMKGRAKRLEISFELGFARILIIIYFFIYSCFTFTCLDPKGPLGRALPTRESSWFFAESISTFLIPFFPLLQFLTQALSSPSRKKRPE